MDNIDDLKKIIENFPSCIFVADNTGKTVLVNKAYEEIIGTGREEVLGRSVDELERKGYFYPSAARLALQEKEEVNVIQTLKSGEQAMVTAVPVFESGGGISFVIMSVAPIQSLHKVHEYAKDTEADMIIHNSRIIDDILQLLKRVAPVDSTVLLLGESGVGKSLFAKYVHKNSDRRNNPLIEINCGSIPDALLESELFGYEKGSFTGASAGGKKGLVELADKGTLFLDEIGEMSLNLQVKLLKLLQDKEFVKIGGENSKAVDVRIICATNKDLRKMVEQNLFREDLYYRINVIPVTIPPLRERKNDIKLLILHFLKVYNDKFDRHLEINRDVIDDLMKYHWPGNIRELQNYIQRLVVSCHEDVVTRANIDMYTVTNPEAKQKKSLAVNDIMPYDTMLEEAEKQLFRMAYEKYRSSYKVADVLGISQSNAHRKIQKYVQDNPYMG